MKIIGHRGAAGLETENTAASLKAALQHKVNAIEFDVRKTKDNQLVLFHDADTKRIGQGRNLAIAKHTLKELQEVTLEGGHRIITLRQALRIIGDTPLFLELKVSDTTELLLAELDARPRARRGPVTVVSFVHSELKRLHQLRPEQPMYVLEHKSAFDIVASARKMRAQGIGLNAGLMNPLTYWLCRRYKLDMYVYTVNNIFVGTFLRVLYPRVMICTNYPDRFNKHRKALRKVTA